MGHYRRGKLSADGYYALVTMHGTIMIFFMLTAGLSGTFANFLIPLQVGARDMASPFLNMLSYWFFFAASMVMLSSLFVETGRPAGVDGLPAIVFIVQFIFILNFFYSAFKGRRVTSLNPWQANTLEWTTPVLAPHGNWPGEIPEVHRWPYDYSKAGRAWIPQTEPPDQSHKVVKNPA